MQNELWMQPDNNLVLYCDCKIAGERGVHGFPSGWDSGSNGKGFV